MRRTHGSRPEEVYEPDDEAVLRRLKELGVPPDVLSEAIRIGYTKGDFTTAAHPVTYPGTVVWGEITAELRQGLAQHGWTFDDTDNIPRAVSPDGAVIVIAVRGNESTGIRNRHEQLNTQRPRGSASVRIIRINTQLELALDGGREDTDDLAADLGGTWFLLYNRTGDVIRNELSFANNVDRSGKLLRWSERLILPDIDLLEPPPASGQDRSDLTPPDVDVPVKRRAS